MPIDPNKPLSSSPSVDPISSEGQKSKVEGAKPKESTFTKMKNEAFEAISSLFHPSKGAAISKATVMITNTSKESTKASSIFSFLFPSGKKQEIIPAREAIGFNRGSWGDFDKLVPIVQRASYGSAFVAKISSSKTETSQNTRTTTITEKTFELYKAKNGAVLDLNDRSKDSIQKVFFGEKTFSNNDVIALLKAIDGLKEGAVANITVGGTTKIIEKIEGKIVLKNADNNGESKEYSLRFTPIKPTSSRPLESEAEESTQPLVKEQGVQFFGGPVKNAPEELSELKALAEKLSPGKGCLFETKLGDSSVKYIILRPLEEAGEAVYKSILDEDYEKLVNQIKISKHDNSLADITETFVGISLRNVDYDLYVENGELGVKDRG